MANIKSIGGNPIVLGMDGLDDDVIEEFDTKADIDGYYAQLTAGAADNLTGRGDATTAEFLYRTAGGTADIETGQAVAKSIKGNTLVWNQLFPELSSRSSSGVTMTANGDGSYTLNGTATADFISSSILNLTLVVGHKYLVLGESGEARAQVYDTAGHYAGSIFTSNMESCAARIIVLSGNTVDNAVVWPQVFDLTQMFGAGNEPSTVAEFEALFPEPYYEYDAGSLLSVNMEGVETVGFNQWDGTWENGGIKANTGQNETWAGRSRTFYIPVFPSTEYYQTSSIAVFYYDADKNYLSARPGFLGPATFTTPSNCHYIRFMYNAAAMPSDTICINLSWSGRRNGEYEAFWKSQRLIDVANYFPDGMRSAGTVYDELTADAAVTRIGVVDLGTLTWTYNTSSANPFFAATLAGAAEPGHVNTNMDATCARYLAGTANYIRNEADYDKRIAYFQGYLNVRDSAYTDPAAFKTAMSGVMLHYALATPTVTPIDPPLNLSYRVDDFGTERIMVPEDERSAPPVLDIAYGLNVVDFVRRAPTEYISHASFQQFCIALQAKLGIVITETWDDTDNRYEYSIADTVTEG